MINKIIITILLWSFSFINSLHALEIIEPKEGQTFEVGSTIRIVMKPDPGEKWAGIRLGLGVIPYDNKFNAFVGEYIISRDMKLGKAELIFNAVSYAGEKVELKRTVYHVEPSDTMLQSLMVEPDPVFLYVLSAESDPNKIRIFMTKKIRVIGVYSDGKRSEISSASKGTTYSSSDANVVTVESDGKTTAHEIGTAVITVKNGSLKKDVQVIVKKYRSL